MDMIYGCVLYVACGVYVCYVWICVLRICVVCSLQEKCDWNSDLLKPKMTHMLFEGIKFVQFDIATIEMNVDIAMNYVYNTGYSNYTHGSLVFQFRNYMSGCWISQKYSILNYQYKCCI